MGQYVTGKPEGFGQYKWGNGSTYTGNFKAGMKHGQGKWRRKPFSDLAGVKGNFYEGSY